MRYSSYNPHYQKQHKRRDAFLGLIRSLISAFREVPIILFILKLCGTVSIEWIGIILILTGYLIADYLFDLAIIAIEEKDEKEETERRQKKYGHLCERSEADAD
jgi:hypothetical protein